MVVHATSAKGGIADEAPNGDALLCGVLREDGVGNSILNLLRKIKG